MNVSRRLFIAGAAGAPFSSRVSAAAPREPIKAIAFDGFPIFDPGSVARLAQRLFPDKGQALAGIWSSKLFASMWLLTAAGRYMGFEQVSEASLSFAVDSVKLDISKAQREDLLAAYSHLDVWPDVKLGLTTLRDKGIRLVFLSNLSEAMLNANMAHNGITSFFEPPLSTDRIRQFKPAPAAYRMATDALGLTKEDIGFAAFGGWDAAGATWFGYRTVWVNRLDVPMERLAPSPGLVSHGIDGVLKLAGLRA